MIRTKPIPVHAVVLLGRMALVTLAALGSSGCIIIPTPSHGGVGLITKETIDSFEPGKTTRADILLRLGNPAERLEGDRLFTYTWEEVQAYIIYAVPYVTGGVAPLFAPYHLCLEFSPENRLKRVQVIKSLPSLKPTPSCLEAWLAEKPESPPS
jgi:hypothetical protein